MEKRDDYKLLKLRDAMACLNQRVNLVGVVLKLSLPKKCKGIDFFISLKIADESYSDPGISVNFFAESVEKLPVAASPGDIILLSHVAMKKHEREVYAFFNKKFSSFALYEGISGGDFIPYQVSARFRTRKLDKKFIANLRKWLTGFRLNTGNMEGDESSVYNGQVASVGQDFDDFHLDILIAFFCIAMLDEYMHTREPIRDNVLSGPEWVREVLYGHPDRVYEAFKMERHVFLNLCDLMKARGWLEDSRYIRVDEQVGIFLSMICHKNSNRDLCERFQRSGQTISKYFTIVLKAILKLAKEVIVPPSFDVVPEEILMDPNHKVYFEGCIGAIDGTHVPASVPVSKQIPFTGKKGITTQNVMCACAFDMKFTFVYAGWEGSASDRQVLSAALKTPHLKFPRPPLGKYYVVDFGYAATPGFLTPFKGERYHPNDYQGGARQPRTARELFNYKHSSLRNIIERSFAALKNRFSILKHMPSFAIQKQAHIVIACCAIHNYIRDQDKSDKNFTLHGDPEYSFGPTQDEVIDDTSTEDETEMNMLRKSIANKMARDHNMPEIP